MICILVNNLPLLGGLVNNIYRICIYYNQMHRIKAKITGCIL